MYLQHLAASKGFSDCVLLLLEFGANPNLKGPSWIIQEFLDESSLDFLFYNYFKTVCIYIFLELVWTIILSAMKPTQSFL